MSIKKISALLVALLIATTAMANDVQKEIELLKQQLIEINKKLLILEQTCHRCTQYMTVSNVPKVGLWD